MSHLLNEPSIKRAVINSLMEVGECMIAARDSLSSQERHAEAMAMDDLVKRLADIANEVERL